MIFPHPSIRLPHSWQARTWPGSTRSPCLSLACLLPPLEDDRAEFWGPLLLPRVPPLPLSARTLRLPRRFDFLARRPNIAVASYRANKAHTKAIDALERSLYTVFTVSTWRESWT